MSTLVVLEMEKKVLRSCMIACTKEGFVVHNVGSFIYYAQFMQRLKISLEFFRYERICRDSIAACTSLWSGFGAACNLRHVSSKSRAKNCLLARVACAWYSPTESHQPEFWRILCFDHCSLFLTADPKWSQTILNSGTRITVFWEWQDITIWDNWCKIEGVSQKQLLLHEDWYAYVGLGETSVFLSSRQNKKGQLAELNRGVKIPARSITRL